MGRLPLANVPSTKELLFVVVFAVAVAAAAAFAVAVAVATAAVIVVAAAAIAVVVAVIVVAAAAIAVTVAVVVVVAAVVSDTLAVAASVLTFFSFATDCIIRCVLQDPSSLRLSSVPLKATMLKEQWGKSKMFAGFFIDCEAAERKFTKVRSAKKHMQL